MLTPADWDQRYEIHLGATFNLSHSLGQLLHLRPRNRFEDIPTACIWSVAGRTQAAGLPVIFESARITSRLLCEDLGLEYPLAEGLADHQSRDSIPATV